MAIAIALIALALPAHAAAAGGAIAGTVTSAATGAPLAEMEVCSFSEPSGFEDSCTYTAGDGTYQIAGLRSDVLHEIQFRRSFDHEAQIIHGVAVAEGGTTPLSVALHRDGRISGHVYAAATGQPLSGIAVCPIELYEGTGPCALTDASGGYLLSFPPPSGPEKVVFSPDPSEFDFSLDNSVEVDAWPTQFWNAKATFAEADVLNVTDDSNFTGIDALLGPGPPPSTPPPAGPPPSRPPIANPPPSGAPAPAPTATSKPRQKSKRPMSKRRRCGKGKVKRRVKGKTRCVRVRNHRRHKPKHHDGRRNNRESSR